MSFGYSVTDFVKLIELANELRHRFVDSPQQFRAISDEVRSLVIVLEDVKVLLPRRELESSQRKQLVGIVAGCFQLLNELKSQLKEYIELDEDQGNDESFKKKLKTVWKRLKWEPKDIEELRGRLSSNIGLLNTFYSQLNLHKALEIQEDIASIASRQVNQEQSDLHSKILAWLTPVDYASQHSDFSSRKQPGTGDWIFESDAFIKWITQPKKTLFCPGIPGAGKTIIASAVIKHIFDRFPDVKMTGVAYIYGNFRRNDDQRPVDILCSLLKQFLQQVSSVPRDIHEEYQDSVRKGGARPPIETMSRLLVSLLVQFDRCFVVLDALDELRAQDPACTGLLSELFSVQEKSRMNLFVTSQFIPELVDHFKQNEDTLSLEIEAREIDVRRYLEGRMSQLPGFVRKNADLQKEIVIEISQSIDGMFLLAQLLLESLVGKRSPKAIRSVFQSLRREANANNNSSTNIIDTQYTLAMERIEGQIGDQCLLGKQVLAWITCAKRSLKPSELQCALAVEIGSSEFDEENLPDVDDMVSACAGLVTIDPVSDIVRLVHYTTQEFFERTWRRWFPSANDDMTNICVTYLSYDVFAAKDGDALKREIEGHVLYDYAARNWGYHAQGGAGNCSMIMEFLQDNSKVKASMNKFKRIRSLSALNLAVIFNLDEFVVRLLSVGHSVDGRVWAAFPNRVFGGRYRTPLCIAAELGFEKIAKILLDAGADPDLPDGGNRSPLWYAASRGEAAVVSCLFDQPVDVNRKENEYGETPLMAAVSRDRIEAVKLLVTHPQVDVNSAYVYGSFSDTSLTVAVQKGNTEIVKILLEQPRLNVNAEPVFNRTALRCAVDKRHQEVVKMLLQRKDLQLELPWTSFQNTPLWTAVRRKDLGIVKLLMEDPRMNPRTAKRTASDQELKLAHHAQEGSTVAQEMLKLLEAGPKVNRDFKPTSP